MNTGKHGSIFTQKVFILLICLGITPLSVFAQEKTTINNSNDFTIDNASDKKSPKGQKTEQSYVIEVTAQKRKQNIQDVAGSITALSSKQIEEAGIKETVDIAAYVPNMTTFDFSESFSYYSIRGQTNFNSYSNSVGIYIDDVPAIISANWTDSHLWNIKQIEILRGPQGNLYGLNSSGGVVNIITTKPDNFWRSSTNIMHGNYNTRHYTGAASGPIVKDTLYFGISGIYMSRDSYIEEEGNQDRVSKFYGARGQLVWTPVDRFDLLFTFESGKRDLNYSTWTLADDDPFKIDNHNHDEYTKSTYHMQSLRLKYALPFCDITSVSAYTTSDEEIDMEYFVSGAMNSENETDTERFVEELRFTSNNAKNPLQWLIGFFYLTGTEEYRNNTIAGGTSMMKADSRTDRNSFALFGQLAYTFFNRLTLTPGIRYDYDSKEFEQENLTTSLDDKKDWSAISPRLSVDYKFTDDAMVYTSLAKGYKAGGYAMASASSIDIVKFEQEDLLSFEIGAKTSWLKNKIIVNLAGFYTSVDNMQLFYYDPATSSHVYTNAGKADLYGIEAEFGLRPVRGLEIMIPVGWIHSEILEHATKEYEGNKVPLTPEYTIGIASQYTHFSGFFARGELNMLGNTYFDEENAKKQNAYNILNVKIGYSEEHVTVALFVNNLLNKEYYHYRVDAGGSSDFAAVGTPRIFGTKVTLEF